MHIWQTNCGKQFWKKQRKKKKKQKKRVEKWNIHLWNKKNYVLRRNQIKKEKGKMDR